MTSTRTVVVASSLRLDAEAASSYLEELDGWEVSATHTDGLAVLAELQRGRPEALLVLHDLERLGPAAVAAQVRRRWPEVSVVVVGAVTTSDATVLPPTTPTERVLEALARPPTTSEQRPTGEGLERLRALTPRERHVLRLLGSGASREEIARTLGTSPHTVRTHMHNLYRKLDAHSHLEIVRFAARHGLVEPRPETDGGST